MSEPVTVGKFNFRFECQPGCTNCCTQSGDVYLNEDDITRIASYLEMERPAFQKRYLRQCNYGKRLRIPLPRSCPFLLEGGCSIHEVKPLQCRAFPYWPENVETRAAWKALRRYCPGVGVGSLVQIQAVRAQAQAYHDAFPGI